MRLAYPRRPCDHRGCDHCGAIEGDLPIPKSPDPAARPYEPSEEQTRLLPEVSGNAINGLGESAPRRPSPIYWHHPSKIAHGPVMKWMLERTSREQPSVDRLHEKFGGRGPAEPTPVAETRAEDTPEDWTAMW